MIHLYLDDYRTPTKRQNGLELPDSYWVVVRTVADAKTILSTGIVDNASLDHDLGPGETGYDLVKWMEAQNVWPKGSIKVHSANPVGAANMRAVLGRNGK
jgi:hypothetical protein